jgi:hypothetical protein
VTARGLIMALLTGAGSETGKRTAIGCRSA